MCNGMFGVSDGGENGKIEHAHRRDSAVASRVRQENENVMDGSLGSRVTIIGTWIWRTKMPAD